MPVTEANTLYDRNATMVPTGATTNVQVTLGVLSLNQAGELGFATVLNNYVAATPPGNSYIYLRQEPIAARLTTASVSASLRTANYAVSITNNYSLNNLWGTTATNILQVDFSCSLGGGP